MNTQIVLWTGPNCPKCKALLKTLSDDRILELAEIRLVRVGKAGYINRRRAKVPGVAMLFVREELKAVLTSEVSAKDVLNLLEEVNDNNS